jgi:hypothetical protein
MGECDRQDITGPMGMAACCTCSQHHVLYTCNVGLRATDVHWVFRKCSSSGVMWLQAPYLCWCELSVLCTSPSA